MSILHTAIWDLERKREIGTVFPIYLEARRVNEVFRSHRRNRFLPFRAHIKHTHTYTRTRTVENHNCAESDALYVVDINAQSITQSLFGDSMLCYRHTMRVISPLLVCSWLECMCKVPKKKQAHTKNRMNETFGREGTSIEREYSNTTNTTLTDGSI